MHEKQNRTKMVQKGTLRNVITIQWKNERVNGRTSATHTQQIYDITHETTKEKVAVVVYEHAHSTMCIAQILIQRRTYEISVEIESRERKKIVRVCAWF